MDILHVDDEDDIREITRMSLEMSGGINVVSANSGKNALEILRTNRPDAILLDVMMPEMSGPDLKAHLLADPDTADIPVVFMTAAARPETIQELLDIGAVGVIRKPFDPTALSEEFLSLLPKAV